MKPPVSLYRWLFLKDSFLAYVRPRDGVICDVMLMDNDFCVENGFGLTGAKHGLQILNLNRWAVDKARITHVYISTAYF